MKIGIFIAGIVILASGLVLSMYAVNNAIANGLLEGYYGGVAYYIRYVVTHPLFIIGAIVGTPLFIVGLALKRKPSSPSMPQVLPSSPSQPVIIKETVKEIVKVKCPFCGTLVDHLQSTCPNCSGILK